jgi:Transposase DDE domain
MSHLKGLCQWRAIVSRHLPTLSGCQAKVLGEYSYGMVMSRSGGISGIADLLGYLKGEKVNSVRQRLREWCYAAKDKAGRKRRAVEVQLTFVWLLRWVLSWWHSTDRQLVLAMDATSLRQCFTVLAISVVYRGSAIPVAWAIVPGTAKGAWQAHWLRLLAALRSGIPRRWCVLVLTDRGLYAPWLYRAIRRYHWHPFMRINTGGQYRPYRGTIWRPLSQIVRQDGQVVARRVVCFKTESAHLPCTLLACWQAAYTDPWLIVTDLPVTQANVAWYAMRAWIEAGFKDLKRGGWHWEQTKMTHPDRAERLWLVMAVATLWTLSVGGEADLEQHQWAALPPLPSPPRLSCFRLGLNRILAAVIAGHLLPVGRFFPHPWPSAPPLC